jgi:hypothetical protein
MGEQDEITPASAVAHPSEMNNVLDKFEGQIIVSPDSGKLMLGNADPRMKALSRPKTRIE